MSALCLANAATKTQHSSDFPPHSFPLQEPWQTLDCNHSHSEESTAHLVAAFLQQTFHKLPVGLGNHWRGEVGQFGLADGAAHIPGFLDVLLKQKEKSKTLCPCIQITGNQYRWVPEEGTTTLHYLTASFSGSGQSLKSNTYILGKTKRTGWINSFSEVKHSLSAGIILALMIQKVKNTQLQHVCKLVCGQTNYNLREKSFSPPSWEEFNPSAHIKDIHLC